MRRPDVGKSHDCHALMAGQKSQPVPGQGMKVAVIRQDPRLDRVVLDALTDIGVSARYFADKEDLLAGDADLGDLEVVFAAGTTRLDDQLFARLPSLHGLVSPYIGTEGFDRAAASARGILIANGQMAESVESMAEGTVLMLLAAAYQLPAAMAAMANGSWPEPIARGRLLRAMTIGIVGYGRIACEVVDRLAPFGCRIVVYARRSHVPLPHGVKAVPLEELLACSDAIVLLASLGPDSHHLIDARMIALIKTGAIIVNTARGHLVDEQALVAAAREGRLGWLALDVFEQEPLRPDATIRTLPNVILTPHCIGHTADTLARLPLHAIEGIQQLLQRSPPSSLVNAEALPAWRARMIFAASGAP